MEMNTKPIWRYLAVLITMIGADSAIARAASSPPSAKGQKVVFIPWMVRNPDRVITLRQPAGYTSLWGGAVSAWLGKDYPNQGIAANGAEAIFLFAALLPDLSPRTPDNLADFTRPGGGDKLEGAVEAGFIVGSDVTEGKRYEIKLSLAQRFLVDLTEPELRNRPLERRAPKFGLNRIGIQAPLPELNPYTKVKDLLFLGEDVERSPLFIVCDSDQRRSKEEDPSAKIVAQCEQTMVFLPLNAVVRFRYRRVFLEDWKNIQMGVERLLWSFTVD
ncbi:hypothetical protein [Microvirga rosea]|uniref:hypothetical protein n=1 Tax=Microvirga rosea TaxID=2715425 RepID=UPI001D0B6924|nr:hypothetical protein [Microvirga rosea]MCB8823182.1 hypothetical protein [Microvirga rosea]